MGDSQHNELRHPKIAFVTNDCMIFANAA